MRSSTRCRACCGICPTRGRVARSTMSNSSTTPTSLTIWTGRCGAWPTCSTSWCRPTHGRHWCTPPASIACAPEPHASSRSCRDPARPRRVLPSRRQRHRRHGAHASPTRALPPSHRNARGARPAFLAPPLAADYSPPKPQGAGVISCLERVRIDVPTREACTSLCNTVARRNCWNQEHP